MATKKPASTKTAAPAKKSAFRNVNAAFTGVRAGDTTTTPDALRAFEAKGAGEASAALAMIAAFGGRWEDAIAHAARAFATPGEIYAGNVWEDLEVLLLRAARETKNFKAAIAAVPTKASWDNGTEIFRRVRKNLANAEAGKTVEAAVEPPRPAVYAKAVAEQEADPKLAKKSESERTRRRFFVAINCGMIDEALALFAKRPTALYYEHVVRIAPALAARGEGDRAWNALVERLWSWSEVDNGQIVPADFLGDSLWPTATPARLATVLATPRGTATWNAAYESGKAEL